MDFEAVGSRVVSKNQFVVEAVESRAMSKNRDNIVKFENFK